MSELARRHSTQDVGYGCVDCIVQALLEASLRQKHLLETYIIRTITGKFADRFDPDVIYYVALP